MADPALGPLIDLHGPPPLRRTRNAFRSLVRTVVGQQLSGTAARTIYDRFRALYPGRAFPTPEDVLQTPEATLRSAGLSGAKARTLHDLATKLTDGTIPRRRLCRLPDGRVREALLGVKGLGPWSVDIFLLFALARPDVLPVGDLGLRKGARSHFGLAELPDAAQLEELTEPWRPYRSAGTWYMWRSLDGPLAVVAAQAS
ncbi:MAG: DNA-3-methyladenine glycosylase family protein [Sandaracinaceae bacterium]